MMPGQIVEEVRGALSTAIAKPDDLGRPGPRNAARSRNFVEALADRLRKTYRDDPVIVALKCLDELGWIAPTVPQEHTPGN